MTVRIAVVQQEVVPGDPQGNVAKAQEHARAALAHGADIVLFPESLTVGMIDDVKRVAEPVDGPTTRAFQRMVAGTEGLILYGLVERAGDDCHIAATLVGRDGVVANYRKAHLWWNDVGPRFEPGQYAPGDRLVTFPVKGHLSGVMICYDGDFPEMTRSYANLDCGMLFWMNNRTSRGHREVERLAWQNSMIMAVSCCCGRNEIGRTCSGGSNITDYDGRLIGEIWHDEGVVYADVDPAAALARRAQSPWYRGRRPELYT
jgi:predicted amidohydrolase